VPIALKYSICNVFSVLWRRNTSVILYYVKAKLKLTQTICRLSFLVLLKNKAFSLFETLQALILLAFRFMRFFAFQNAENVRLLLKALIHNDLRV